MACEFRNRVFAASLAIIGLGIISLVMQPAQAGNFSWSGSAGATWNTSSTNWTAQSGTTNVAQPWSSTTGPSEQANFISPGSSVNVSGGVYIFAMTLTSAAGGVSISGGTINTTSSSDGGANGSAEISMSATSGTDTISSMLALGNTVKPEFISTPTGAASMLNLTGLITSNGTVALNAGGTTQSGNGSTIALGAAGDSFNVLEETGGNHGTILIPTGGSVSCNLLFATNFCVNLVNGNLTCGNIYSNTTNPTTVFTGSGTISTVNFVANNGSTNGAAISIGAPTSPFTGSFNVSGSFALGLGNPVFCFGTTGQGKAFYQTSGTVQLTGGGDSVVVGSNGSGNAGNSTYNMFGGFLNVPNAPMELGYGSNAAGTTSTYSQTGGVANMYGISMGTTQSNGSQPGNCAISITGGTLNLGAGGISSGTAGTYSVTLGNATIGTSATWSTSLPVTLGGSTSFNLSGGGNITLAGNVGESSPGVGAMSVNGGSMTLSGNNAFSGGVTMGPAAALYINNNSALGSGTLTINGGLIDSTTAGVALGSVPQNWNGDFTFGGSNNLNLGTGAVSLGGSRTVTLNGGVLTVGGPISDGGAGYSLSMTSPSGTGTLVLAGTSSYSGGTNVNSGVLIVNGALTGSGVTVAPGATLSGSGTVSGGAVTLGSGAKLSPGPSPAPGSAGTFTAASLSVGSGATIAFDLSDSAAGLGVNDLVAVTGNLSLPGSATIAVTPTAGTLAQNVAYPLFDYGSLTNTGSPLVYSGPLGARQFAIFNYGTGSNSAITLSISGYFANLTWTGTGTNASGSLTWDQNDTANKAWTSPQNPNNDYFAAADNVTFDATSAPGNQTVTLSGSDMPTSVLVTGTKNYTFTGSGNITGITGLTVAGPGTLTIANSGNNYSGGTNIQGGSIILGVSNGLSPNGTVTFGGATTGGTLDLAGNSQTVGGLSVAALATPANQIITNSTGSATLTCAGTGSTTFGGTIQDTAPTGVLALNVAGGELVLGGNNTYAGGTTVSGGTLQLGVTNALPTGGNITALPGGILDLGGNVQTTSGTASFQGGTVQNGTLTSTVADFDARSGTIAASLSGPVALDKTTSGTLVVSSPSNTYANGTNISGGILQLGAANALPTGGNVTVYSGGAFDLGGAGAGQMTSGTVSIQGGTIQNGTLTSTSVAFDGQSGTVTANLTGNVGLTKTTAGLLNLGGSSTYTGDTVVSAGTLLLGSAAGVPGGPGAGNVDLDGGAVSAAVIDINGFSPDFGGLSGAAGAVPGTITNNGATGGTLTVGDNNGTTTFSGTIADGTSRLGLIKSGNGTLTLAGSNTYSGGTTVAQGILAPTTAAALGTVTSSTNLTVNNGGELQLPAAVVNAGIVSVAGNGFTGLGAINGGTLSVLGNSVTNNAPSNTAVIGSPTVLDAATTTLVCASASQTLLFNAVLTSTGNVTTSGSGNFEFGGGTANIAGTLQEGNSIPSRTAIISVLPGTTLNVGTYYVPFFSTLTVNGTMNAATIITANSTAGQQFLNGSGVINAATFIGSGGGTARFSNGVLNITGSLAVGQAVPALGAAVACTLEQDSGTINVTGTGDGFTLGYSNSSSGNGAYTQFGGVLNVPNEYVELCYESGAGGNSFFQVLGTATTANVYGISFGQTVNNGVQNGNGTVKLGNAGALLVIGAGGIVSATSGSAQIFLGTGATGGGTLASSAPWSTALSITLTGSLPTNIDASAGTISLDGTLSSTGGLQEVGSGVLVLGGTNTYTGGTTVASGELIATNSEAIEDGTDLSVGAGLSAFGAVVPVQASGAAAAQAVATVPEPGALMLLAAAGTLLFFHRRRR